MGNCQGLPRGIWERKHLNSLSEPYGASIVRSMALLLGVEAGCEGCGGTPSEGVGRQNPLFRCTKRWANSTRIKIRLYRSFLYPKPKVAQRQDVHNQANPHQRAFADADQNQQA